MTAVDRPDNGQDELDSVVQTIAAMYRDPEVARYAMNDLRDWLSGDREAPSTAVRAALRAANLPLASGRAGAGEQRLPESSRGDGPCMDCGTLDTPVWFTDNVLWNRIVGDEGTMDDPGGLLCPICFIGRAERVGLRPTAWHLTAEFPWRWES